tara:strand:- start:4284 stop:4649 length:366 start_codon:yes stop_codon:yes gene_type:complete
MPNFKKNTSPFMMKSSPAKMWPFGKTTKSKKVEDGYEIKEKTYTRGDVTKTKTSKRLLAGEKGKGGVWDVITKTKTKGGEEVKSSKKVIDKGGKRMTKTTTKKGETKTVTWDDGEKTVTKS